MRQLRSMVEKWLAPLPDRLDGTVRVQRFRDRSTGGRRYVRVEVSGSLSTACLHFFEHEDGQWQVFPPPRPHPVMGADMAAQDAIS